MAGHRSGPSNGNNEQSGFTLLYRQQKPALAVGEGACGPLEQLLPGCLELRQFDQFLGHAGEVVGEQILDRFAVRLQKLCDRSPVTSEGSDERLAYGIRDRTRCLKMHDVEEVARVLSVQRRSELSGIQVL